VADLIDELSGMDDAALANKLGFADKVKAFRDDLARAGKLAGDPRKKVLDTLDRMFRPSIYPDELHYTVESAERKAAGKTTPSEIVSCCGDCD
jgi:hypothetical protein